MIQQLQSWPTPEMFIVPPGAIVTEPGAGLVRLVSITVPLPEGEHALADSYNTGLAAVSLIFPGPISRSVTDGGLNSLQAVSITIPSAVSETATDPANAAASLVSITLPTGAGSSTVAESVPTGVRLISISI